MTFALRVVRISGWSLGNCIEVEGADRKIEFVLHGERNDALPSVHLDWVFSELCVHIYIHRWAVILYSPFNLKGNAWKTPVPNPRGLIGESTFTWKPGPNVFHQKLWLWLWFCYPYNQCTMGWYFEVNDVKHPLANMLKLPSLSHWLLAVGTLPSALHRSFNQTPVARVICLCLHCHGQVDGIN